MLTLVVLSIALSNGVLGQTTSSPFYACDYITAFADCNRFITGPYCGTNVVTYNNKCEFSKAHCADPTIDLLHAGSCTDADIATALPVAGNEVIVDFFCTSLSKDDCPTSVSKICATDGRTYVNYCEYEKAKCTHRDLHVTSYGDCP